MTPKKDKGTRGKPIKINADFDSAMGAFIAVETRRKKKRKAKK